MYAYPPLSGTAASASDPTARLNAVHLTGERISAALEALAMLPGVHRDDPRSQALVLQACARDAGFEDDVIAGAAMHARVTALAKWIAVHDPARQSGPDAIAEATARHPLVESEHGIAFEPSGFQELILFIDELPW